jgi:hypothetical protein
MSRYLRLRAEQVRMTLWGASAVVFSVGCRRVAIAVSRSRISQSQRSASVRGSPRAILAMLEGVWYCGLVGLVSFLCGLLCVLLIDRRVWKNLNLASTT